MMKRLRAAPLLLAALLAGCVDDLGPTSPELENSIFSLLGGLEVGEALLLAGDQADSVYLAGGPSGAEYLYVPFFASEAGEARLEVEVQGSNVDRLESSSAALVRAELPVQRRLDWTFHEQLMERTAREISPRLAGIGAAASRSGTASSRAARMAVPAQVGARVELNTAASCNPTRRNLRVGRVEAVGRTAIVVADSANPVDGFSAADYAAVAQQFDELVSPTIVRHFGDPTDIDRNQRVIIFFTRAVNELTPPNSGSYIGGFFWAGDLIPRQFCPGSNEAEIFYQMVADPRGEINTNTFPTEFVRESTLGIVGHEFQHLINAGRRIHVNDAETLEDVWLDEGLSHVAEELLFYAASGLRPGQNIDLETLRSSRQVLNAVNTLQIDNLVRFAFYMQQPHEESLLGIDNLETRGATWAFLRYAADHDSRPDETFFRQLVNSRVAGTENLARVLGSDAIDLMQAWTVSVYTDDHVRTQDARFQQPSWNFRSIIPVLYRNNRFPLQVQTLNPDRQVQLRLRGGGSAFVRVKGSAGRQALISTSSGGRIPPDRLRVAIIRVR